MEKVELIALNELCTAYEVEMIFFETLIEHDLIEIVIVEDKTLIEDSNLKRIEQILRLHNELNVNIEGIDVILNLLQRVDDLSKELEQVKSKLCIYEEE